MIHPPFILLFLASLDFSNVSYRQDLLIIKDLPAYLGLFIKEASPSIPS